MGNRLQEVKNYFNKPAAVSPLAPAPKKGYPRFAISPVQFERIRHDVQMWREAIQEAENALYPQRVRMQRIYQDTILNDHVDACIRRRRNLTLLRKFKMCDEQGNVNEEVTKLFKSSWFRNFQSYCLDALFTGYNLISLGDLVKDSFPNLSFVKRQHVSPDRLVVTNFLYSLTGEKFLEPPYDKWYIYVKTPTETGASPCGYGLLYKIARTEILLRNNLGQNADYNEVFGQPIRKATTTKQDSERDVLEEALRTMGSNPYIILDDGADTLELVTQGGGATAYMTYENLEKRCEAKISKVILGHADALDSTPGKLGSVEGEKSPAMIALMDTQSEDADFLQPIINEELIPRMRELGIGIPDNLHFEYENDDEKESFRAKEDQSNKVTAEIAQTMNSAGLLMDAKYFEERTGIPTKKKEEPKPVLPPGGPAGLPNGFGKKEPAILNVLAGLAEVIDFVEGEHPRVPKGNSEGGQWTKKGGTGTATKTEGPQLKEAVLDKAMTALKETGGFSITDLGYLYGGAMQKTIDELLTPNGLTIGPPEKHSESGNFIVALGGFEHQIPLNSFDKTDIKDYFTKYKNKFINEQNLILGGWHNKDNDVVYLDISKAFKSKAEAIKFGKMSKQIAGWDAKAGKEFAISRKVKNTLTPEQQSIKMAAMYGTIISVLDEEDEDQPEENETENESD